MGETPISGPLPDDEEFTEAGAVEGGTAEGETACILLASCLVYCVSCSHYCGYEAQVPDAAGLIIMVLSVTGS